MASGFEDPGGFGDTDVLEVFIEAYPMVCLSGDKEVGAGIRRGDLVEAAIDDLDVDFASSFFDRGVDGRREALAHALGGFNGEYRAELRQRRRVRVKQTPGEDARSRTEFDDL